MKHAALADPSKAPDWLEAVRLGLCDWRVSDLRIDTSDPMRLLGYVERIERHRYEVLWMSKPISWAYVSSFNIALAALAQDVPFAGTIEVERDPALLARAPSPFRRQHRRTASTVRAVSNVA